MGGVRGDAGHHALEGQRAGLGADDVEARRLGDQARVEGGVALAARRRRPSPPSSSEATATSTTSAARAAGAAPPRPARAAPPPPRPSCRRCRGRSSQPSSSAPDHGPWRHGTVPSGTTSTWPLTARRPAPRSPRDRRRSGPTARSRGASSPGWSGCGAQRREVVLVQVRAQAERRRPARRGARARRARRRSRWGPARAPPRRRPALAGRSRRRRARASARRPRRPGPGCAARRWSARARTRCPPPR